LRVDAPVEAELDDRTASGKVSWVGVEQSPAGGTRLRLRLQLGEKETAARQRRDQTLPYFSTDAGDVSAPPIVVEESAAAAENPRRLSRRRERSGSHAHMAGIVRMASRRRALLAGLRIFVALVAATAAVLLVRSARQSAKQPSAIEPQRR
jgi:hypothetical protein